jgi:hypothetical protein
MLAQHAGDDFVADLTAYRPCVLRPDKNRRVAEERRGKLARHGCMVDTENTKKAIYKL